MAQGLSLDILDRAPEEYPVNLGIPRPEILRMNCEAADIVRQAKNCYVKKGYIELLAFWGVGWRNSLAPIDRLGMAHLAMLKSYVQKAFLRGVRMTLLVGDNHAQANMISSATIKEYSFSIEMLAKEFSLQTRRLSDIISFPQMPLTPTQDQLSKYEPLKKKFEGSAWRLDEKDYQQRALQYFLVRTQEAPRIHEAYPQAILATADTPDRMSISPQLPLLWIFALPGRKWRHEKPWFVEESGV